MASITVPLLGETRALMPFCLSFEGDMDVPIRNIQGFMPGLAGSILGFGLKFACYLTLRQPLLDAHPAPTQVP